MRFEEFEDFGETRKIPRQTEDCNPKFKPNKCFLFQKSVQFLGHVVSDKGVSCDPQKVEAITSWKVPTNVKELRSFLGLCNYYNKIIYSTLMKPLSELTSPKVNTVLPISVSFVSKFYTKFWP